MTVVCLDGCWKEASGSKGVGTFLVKGRLWWLARAGLAGIWWLSRLGVSDLNWAVARRAGRLSVNCMAGGGSPGGHTPAPPTSASAQCGELSPALPCWGTLQ